MESEFVAGARDCEGTADYEGDGSPIRSRDGRLYGAILDLGAEVVALV